MHGTTGYEFAAAVNGLFVDRRNSRRVRLAVRLAHGRFAPGLDFDDLAYVFLAASA